MPASASMAGRHCGSPGCAMLHSWMARFSNSIAGASWPACWCSTAAKVRSRARPARAASVWASRILMALSMAARAGSARPLGPVPCGDLLQHGGQFGTAVAVGLGGLARGLLQRLLRMHGIAGIALDGRAQPQTFHQQRAVAFGPGNLFRGIESGQRIGVLLLGIGLPSFIHLGPAGGTIVRRL